MTPRGVVAQHLHVHHADQQLLEVPPVELGLLQPRLERLDLAGNDGVLLRLGLALPDGPHQRVELPAPRRRILLGQAGQVVHGARRRPGARPGRRGWAAGPPSRHLPE